MRLNEIYAKDRRNSIGFLRFFFAVCVVFSHTYPLGGFGADPLEHMSGTTLGTHAVNCFFILSGFLVARSYASVQSLGRFLWHRVLRIFPGYWACLLVTVFGFGPLLYYLRPGEHTLAGYFAVQVDPALSYLTNNSLLVQTQLGLAGLLRRVPLAMVINGVLWTLEQEFRCYLVVGLFGALGLLGRRIRFGRALVLALFLMLIVWMNVPPLRDGGYLSADVAQTVALALWFFAGWVFYLFAESIPVRRLLFVAAALASIVAVATGYHTLIGPLSISYCIFWLALELPLEWWDRRADLSYGLYIYAFPVQQLFASLHVQRFGLWAYFALSLCAATPLAALSWMCVERPALRLKGLKLRKE